MRWRFGDVVSNRASDTPSKLLEVVGAEAVSEEVAIDRLLLGRQPEKPLVEERGNVKGIDCHIEQVPPHGEPEDLADWVIDVEENRKRARSDSQKA